MTRRSDLARLQALAEMVETLRMSEMRAAAAACAQTRDRMRDLEAGPAPDLPPIAAARAALLYDRWADARRAELNMVLARQTVALSEAQDAARLAFGRARALEAVAARRR